MSCLISFCYIPSERFIMTEKKFVPNYSILLLVAPQFHETEVSSLIRHLREIGISIVLTSLTEGVVVSEFGMKLKADYSLENLQFTVSYPSIIITGSDAATRALLRDPRVYELLKVNSRSSRSFFAGTTSAEMALRDYGLLESCQPWILQHGKSISEFAKQVASMLIQVV